MSFNFVGISDFDCFDDFSNVLLIYWLFVYFVERLPNMLQCIAMFDMDSVHLKPLFGFQISKTHCTLIRFPCTFQKHFPWCILKAWTIKSPCAPNQCSALKKAFFTRNVLNINGKWNKNISTHSGQLKTIETAIVFMACKHNNRNTMDWCECTYNGHWLSPRNGMKERKRVRVWESEGEKVSEKEYKKWVNRQMFDE